MKDRSILEIKHVKFHLWLPRTLAIRGVITEYESPKFRTMLSKDRSGWAKIVLITDPRMERVWKKLSDSANERQIDEFYRLAFQLPRLFKNELRKKRPSDVEANRKKVRQYLKKAIRTLSSEHASCFSGEFPERNFLTKIRTEMTKNAMFKHMPQSYIASQLVVEVQSVLNDVYRALATEVKTLPIVLPKEFKINRPLIIRKIHQHGVEVDFFSQALALVFKKITGFTKPSWVHTVVEVLLDRVIEISTIQKAIRKTEH